MRNKLATVMLFCVLFCLQGALKADTLAGFSLNSLAPVLPGGETTSTVTTTDPFTGNTWMSTGQTLYLLDKDNNTWTQSISVLQADGGPVSNTSVTTNLIFDASGNMYINDFNAGIIYKSINGGSNWSFFASVSLPREMQFDGSGNLIVLGGNVDPTLIGFVSSINSLGSVSVLGSSQGESFVFDPFGDLVIPKYDGTGINKFAISDGNVTSLVDYSVFDDPNFAKTNRLFEAIALTEGGNYILGVNASSIDDPLSQLVGIAKLDGKVTVIGTNIDGSIPVDIEQTAADSYTIAGYGSLHALELTGDFDAAISGVPEPSSFILLSLGGLGLYLKRRRLLTC